MISTINDADFVNAIDSNQTAALFKKYKSIYPLEEEALALLGQVNLMTPENIHLNSFMFEPILDMSAHHLYTLYGKISDLGSTEDQASLNEDELIELAPC